VRRADGAGATLRPGAGSAADDPVPPAGPGDRRGLIRIGAVASLADVSERTLRYYEEVGLISPAAHQPGGGRLYTEQDVARVRRIRELQRLMGFNLEEIRAVTSALDEVEALRDRIRGTSDAAAQLDMVAEAAAALEDLRSRVAAKAGQMQAFLAEVDAKIARCHVRLRSGPAGRGAGHAPPQAAADSPQPPRQPR
jgi:DNA-binding transcriptional MerR regulator